MKRLVWMLSNIIFLLKHKLTPNHPIGLGVKHKLTPNHPIGLGVKYKLTPTDPAAEGGVPTIPIWWGGYRTGCFFNKSGLFCFVLFSASFFLQISIFL